jgi:hypothetical protein
MGKTRKSIEGGGRVNRRKRNRAWAGSRKRKNVSSSFEEVNNHNDAVFVENKTPEIKRRHHQSHTNRGNY